MKIIKRNSESGKIKIGNYIERGNISKEMESCENIRTENLT